MELSVSHKSKNYRQRQNNNNNNNNNNTMREGYSFTRLLRFFRLCMMHAAHNHHHRLRLDERRLWITTINTIDFCFRNQEIVVFALTQKQPFVVTNQTNSIINHQIIKSCMHNRRE